MTLKEGLKTKNLNLFGNIDQIEAVILDPGMSMLAKRQTFSGIWNSNVMFQEYVKKANPDIYESMKQVRFKRDAQSVEKMVSLYLKAFARYKDRVEETEKFIRDHCCFGLHEVSRRVSEDLGRTVLVRNDVVKSIFDDRGLEYEVVVTGRSHSYVFLNRDVDACKDDIIRAMKACKKRGVAPRKAKQRPSAKKSDKLYASDLAIMFGMDEQTFDARRRISLAFPAPAGIHEGNIFWRKPDIQAWVAQRQQSLTVRVG